MNQPKIILFLGKSAAGKDTAINYLLEKYPNFERLVSYTTRPIRIGEIEGKTYHFIDKDHFLKMDAKKEFLEHRKYETLFNGKKDTWYYGITKESLNNKNKILLTAVDFTGYEKIKEYYGENNIQTLYIDSPTLMRTIRAQKRGSFSFEEWNRRVSDDEIKFSREQLNWTKHYCIENISTKDDFFKEIEKYLEKYIF